ncbi:MAG: tannase/feruloyl esterase family alpha/beta hydrolase [Acidobacteriota bacterium]
MNRMFGIMMRVVPTSLFFVCLTSGVSVAQTRSADEEACQALLTTRDLTLRLARLVEATETTPRYCYVKGVISPAIVYQVQLPLPREWNGRFVNWGDGAKDGDLDFADHRVAQGYAVANSNTGHDSGSEPGASFGHNNRQAEIDFGYRAVHLTVNAAKTVIAAYYGKEAAYSYHEGCSTGGRQGLMEAQRYPYDFDGIIAGAPVNFYQELNTTHVWMLQRVFEDNFAGNLAFDTDGDGAHDSLTKLRMLTDTVMAKCDVRDSIADGVVDDPLSCDFDPDVDLKGKMCSGDVNADECFTQAQLQLIKDFYRGAYDSHGVTVLKGLAPGAENRWIRYLAHAGNDMFPLSLVNASNHASYLFYEDDPGVPVHDPVDLSYRPIQDQIQKEWAWWEFNIDDVTSDKADFMRAITNSTDPDLTRFLVDNDGKLLLYHGWVDVSAHPEPTLDYYKDVIQTTFQGDTGAAREDARIFMVPGMAHCGGGPGPNSWDKLAPLVAWVERGEAPDYVVATHSTNGTVENERKVCAYPELAVYSGPAGGQNDPANWVEENFTCQ